MRFRRWEGRDGPSFPGKTADAAEGVRAVTEAELRADIVWWGKSLFDRGLTSGTSGNISVRCGDGFLATPTNSCLGRLDPARLSRLDGNWRLLDGDPPTKEIALHRPFYDANPANGAVVHLHSTHATALSCRADIDPGNPLRAATPYLVMRLGAVPVLPYARPGSDALEPRLRDLAATHAGVLLGNHGPIVAGRTLTAAAAAIEELEEAAKLAHLLRDLPVRYLTGDELDELHHHFGGR